MIPGMNNANTPAGTAYTYGYARVSTSAQDLTRQLDALNKANIPDERIYADKKSGKSAAARAGLQELLAAVRPGDTIVVCTLDRLGRNLRETLNMIHDLAERGVYLRSLTDSQQVDTARDDAMSRMSILMLAIFAEMERVYARERAAHARQVRRENGKPVGRPRAHSAEAIEYASLLRQQGHSYAEVSRKTGIPVASLHRYLTAQNGGGPVRSAR